MGFFNLFKRTARTVETDLLEIGRTLGAGAVSIFHEVAEELETANDHLRAAATEAREEVEYYLAVAEQYKARAEEAVRLVEQHNVTLDKVKALLP